LFNSYALREYREIEIRHPTPGCNFSGRGVYKLCETNQLHNSLKGRDINGFLELRF